MKYTTKHKIKAGLRGLKSFEPLVEVGREGLSGRYELTQQEKVSCARLITRTKASGTKLVEDIIRVKEFPDAQFAIACKYGKRVQASYLGSPETNELIQLLNRITLAELSLLIAFSDQMSTQTVAIFLELMKDRNNRGDVDGVKKS